MIAAYLIATLTATSLAKLGQLRLVITIAQRGRVIPVRAAAMVVVATSIVEFILATSLAVGFEPEASAIAVTALFVIFAVYRLLLAAKTKSLMCGCAGSARSDPAHPPIVIATTLACLSQAGLAGILIGWRTTAPLSWIPLATWMATLLVAVGGSMKTIVRRHRIHQPAR